MRRFPTSWKQTRAALGLAPAGHRAKTQRKPARRPRSEPLEARHLLSASPTRPAYAFATVDSSVGYDPAQQFVLATEYDPATDQPRAVLTLRDDLTTHTRETGLQEIGVELRQGDTVLQTQAILVDIAESEFLGQFRADRTEAAGAVLSETAVAAPPTDPANTLPIEQLLDVEAFLTGRRTDSIDSAEAVGYYTAFRNAFIATGDARNSAPDLEAFDLAADRLERLGSAGSLLSGRLRLDGASNHPALAAAAHGATEVLRDLGGSFYTMFSGLGVNQELAREENFGGAEVFVLALVEEPAFTASDSLRVELGDQPAMVQATILNPAGIALATAGLSAQVGVATQDTYVSSIDAPGTTHGADSLLAVSRSGSEESHAVFSIDLAGVDALAPGAATLTLDAATASGTVDHRIEAHHDFWTPNLWSESTLTWSDYQPALASGFRTLDGGTTTVTGAGPAAFDVTDAVRRALLGGDADANGAVDATPGATRGDLEAIYLAVSDPQRYATEYAGSLGLLDNAPDGGKDFLYRNDLNWDGAVTPADLYVFGKRVDALGDFNLDGVVDGADYSVWQANYGKAARRFQEGDGNANGVVDLGDYTIWNDGEARTETADPYNGAANPPELTFRVVPDTDGVVTYTAPTAGAVSIAATASAALRATEFHSPAGSTGWTIGYEVLHDAVDEVVVEAYQTAVRDGVRGASVLAYESAPLSGGVGPAVHTVDAGAISLPDPGAEHVLEVRLRAENGSLVASRDFSHGVFFDADDALHAYGGDDDELLQVAPSQITYRLGTTTRTLPVGSGVPLPTAIYAQLGNGADALGIDLGPGYNVWLDRGRGDDTYYLSNAGVADAAVALRDGGGFDTLGGFNWAPVAPDQRLDLRDAAPQTIAFAPSTASLTIDFERGGEVQFAYLPSGLNITGPGYSGSALTVDSLSSEYDGDLGVGEFSLREAIELANRLPGHQTIDFAEELFYPGPATILVGSHPEVAGAANEFHLRDDVTIQGPGRELLTIDAAYASRLFSLDANQSVVLRDLSGRGGMALGTGYGGAIHANGELTLERTAWIDNVALGGSSSGHGRGGVIWAGPSDLTIRDSVLRGNTARQGGAIYYRPDTGGELRIEGSSLVENRSENTGGTGFGSAITVYSFQSTAGSVAIVNSTLSNNEARNGAVIYVYGASSGSQLSVEIQSSTIVENRANNSTWTAGIVDRTQGVVSLRNSVLTDNRSVGAPRDGRGNLDVEHSLVGYVVRHEPTRNGWYKYLSDGSEPGVLVLDAGEVSGLRPLSDGVAPFHTLEPDSLAINAGSNSPSDLLTNDQRGAFHQRVVGGTIDLGAIEAHVVKTGVDSYAVYGTGGDDSITVAPNGLTIDRLPTERLDEDLTGLSQIEVFALEGDDIVFVDESLVFPALIDAGDGDDFVLGGGGGDQIRGGLGADTLRGRAGADTLWGDEGADLLVGGDGYTHADTLYGGPGYDEHQDDEFFDTIDLGTGQNNTLSEDDTPVATYFGSPVWSLGDQDATPPTVSTGENIFLRHDSFDSDAGHDLEFTVTDRDGNPVGGIGVGHQDGLLKVTLPHNGTDATVQHDLTVQITDRTPPASGGSAAAGLPPAASAPRTLSIPFTARVVPKLEITSGFGGNAVIWAGPGGLITPTPARRVYAPFTTTSSFGVTGAEDYEFSHEGLPPGGSLSSDGVFTWEVDESVGPGAWRSVVTVTSETRDGKRTQEIVGYFTASHIIGATYAEANGWNTTIDYVLNLSPAELGSNGEILEWLELYPHHDVTQLVAYDMAVDPGVTYGANYDTADGGSGSIDPSQTTMTLGNGPEWGEVQIDGANFTYVPGPEFPGYDEFEYSVKSYDPSAPHDTETDESNKAIVRIGGGVREIRSATPVQVPIEDDGDQGGHPGGHPGGQDCCECSCGGAPTVSVAPASGAATVTLPDGGSYRSPTPPSTIAIDVDTRLSSAVNTPSSESSAASLLVTASADPQTIDGPDGPESPDEEPVASAPSSSGGNQIIEVYGVDQAFEDPPILLGSSLVNLGGAIEERTVFLPLDHGGPQSAYEGSESAKTNSRSAYYNFKVSTWGHAAPPEDTFEPTDWVVLLGNDDYGFGRGWNYAEIERLVFRPDDPGAETIYWMRSDGRINSFAGLGAEANRSSSGAIVSATAGGLAITDDARNRLEFDAWGWITRRVDAYGNALEYTYEYQGSKRQRLASVTSTRTGDLTEYVWEVDSKGRDRVVEIIDPQDRVTSFEYWTDGNPRWRDLPGPNENTAGPRTTFFYQDGRLASIRDDNAGLTQIVYDDLAGVTTVTSPAGDETATHITNPRSPKNDLIRGSGNHAPSFATPKVALGSVEDRPGSRVGADGRPAIYTTSPDGRVVATESVDGLLTTYEYNGRGQVLVAEIVGGGEIQRTTYEYDADGRLTKVYHPDLTPEDDSDNPVSTFTYDAFGRTTSATDELGRTTTHAYTDYANLPGALQTVVTTVIVGQPGGGDDLVSAEHYGPDGLLERTVAYRNDVDGTPLDGLVTEFTYTPDGLSERIVYGHDTAGDGVLVAAAALSVRVLERDQYDYPVRIEDELGRVTTYDYNDIGQLMSTVLPAPGPGAATLRIDYDYDDLGRVRTATRSADGGNSFDQIVTSYTYDKDGRVTRLTDGGQTTLYAYEGGNLVSTTDPLNRKTQYEYDLRGRVNKVVLPDPDGPSQPRESPVGYYTYDAFGRLTGEVDPAGGILRYEYDVRGRLTESRNADGVTTLDTDDVGQLLSVTDPAARSDRRWFDDAGRLVKEWSPGRAAPTTFRYDTAGNLRFVTDPLGETTERVYDAFGRLTTEIDSNGAATSYTYYDDGQIESLTDPALNTTTWLYDNAGRLIEEQNESGESRHYGYDVYGRLTQATDRLGRIITHSYDHAGHLDKERWYLDAAALASNASLRTIDYDFDSAGQLRLVRHPGGGDKTDSTYTFTYDNLGLVTEADYYLLSLGQSNKVANTYDRAGRLTEKSLRVRTTDDFVNTYQYDTLGRVTQITQAGVAGGAGVAEKRVDFGYSRLGQIESIDRYADLLGQAPIIATTVDYDWASRVERITHGGPDISGSLVTHGYAYDASDRLVRYSNSIDGDTTYEYDARGQLLAVDHPDSLLTAFGLADESYQYDANGNRQSAGAAAYTTEENNRLASDGAYTFTYDAEGNRTARFLDQGDGTLGSGDTDVTLYGWDHRNRLTSVVTLAAYGGVEQKRVEHTYDAFNQWIGRLVTDGPDTRWTAWLYDAGQAILQLDRDQSPYDGYFEVSDITHRYLWGPGVDQLLADEQITTPGAAGDTLWALTDHLVTVRDLAVATGDPLAPG